MKRLKIKQWIFLLLCTMCITLFQGCNKNKFVVLRSYYGMAQFGFIESEQVVEVDMDTKSFRIVGEWTVEGERDDIMFSPYADSPLVYLDTVNTTALPDIHFINEEEPRLRTIGDFTPMDSDHMYYKEVKLLPENITGEIIIYYDIDYGLNFHKLIQRHKVIIRPKAKSN